MALVIPSGFGHVIHTLQLTGLAREAQVTYGLDTTNFGSDAAACASSCYDLFVNEFKASVGAAVTFTSCKVKMLTAGGVDLLGEKVGTSTGTLSGQLYAANSAALVRKSTGRAGRKHRGRFYLPWCLLETAVDEKGMFTGASWTALNTACTSFFNHIKTGSAPATAGADMFILHDDLAKPPIPPPTEITALVLDNMIATQRRRMR